MLLRTKKRTNPLFWTDELRLLIGAERTERALHDPDSVDLLVWNVFSSLDRHADPAWVAQRLQALGGDTVRAPMRLSLFTGATREPLLTPSRAYLDEVSERIRRVGGSQAEIAEFSGPVEVPVRLDAPDVVALVDAVVHRFPAGRGGRDRMIDLVDAAIEQARRVGKRPAVAVVYASGGDTAAEVSGRLRALREPATLARELPSRGRVPDVVLRELSWQQLLRMWQAELGYLDLGGQPVRAFTDHCRARGLL